MKSRPVCLLGLFACLISLSTMRAAELDFRGQELPTRLTVGYAVRLLDMNEDKRLDLVIVDSKRFLWLENPNWDEHVIFEDKEAKNDNVCFAPADIDGDGRLDFAVGRDWQFGNTKSGGTIGWITGGDDPTKPWRYHHIGEEPTTHRMQFFDLNGDKQPQLVVAPLKGRDTTGPEYAENGVRLLSYKIPKDPVKGPWKPEVITDKLHVMHNFWPVKLGSAIVLTASFDGVHVLHPEGEKWLQVRVGTGDQKSRPNRGASEIKMGALEGTFPAASYIATIEPWHGNKVVVYTPPEGDDPPPETGDWLWTRHVLDDRLKWGHAVFCANLDDDVDQELIIGVRDDLDKDNRRGLRIYDPENAGEGKWKRYVVDPGSVAIEDLSAADLNGDGKVDIVAVGRQTHNVKIYWNETK